MKKLLFLLIFSPALALAQSLSPTVIASAGTSLSATNTSLDFTIGEVAITTLSSSANLLTQGFHQGYTTVTGIDEPIFAEGLGLAVYPNPVSDNLTVSFINPNANPCRLSLCDITGQVIADYGIVRPQSMPALQLPVQGFSPGMYFLRIQSLDGNNAYSLKIIKSSY